MSTYKSFVDSLAEEALTDLADTFFGARRQVENMLEVFRSAVEKMHEYEAEIASRASLLHWVLLNGKSAEAFYQAIGVGTPEALLENKASPSATAVPIPRGLTARGRYARLVVSAYNSLVGMCDTYMNGRNIVTPEGDREEPDIHYRQLIAMGDIINQQIARVNTEISPSWTLQRARLLDTEAADRECLVGMSWCGGGISGIDEKLAFTPIDLKSLDLKVYPELPALDTVRDRIERFCRALYSDHKTEIRDLLETVKSRRWEVEKLRS
jgi:hypothetical protein